MSSQSAEVIERQIADKRQELADKVGLLSDRTAGTVRGAIRSATDVVGATTDTIGTIGDTVGRIRGIATPHALAEVVRDTVGAIPLQTAVDKNPWASVGGAAAAGFIVGLLVSRPPQSGTRTLPFTSGTPVANGAAATGPRSPLGDLLDRLIDRVGTEVRRVAQNAVDSTTTAVSERVNGLVSSVTDKVAHGGSPFGRN